MKNIKEYQEFTYLQELKNVLQNKLHDNAEISTEVRIGNSPHRIDLMISTNDGKLIAIEVKNSQHYKDLPIGTLSQLYDVKNNLPIGSKVILISFSKISDKFVKMLDNLNIDYISSENNEINKTSDFILSKYGEITNSNL
jgi:hypothetical protein